MSANVPPADELAALRDTIAALKKREAELRTLMLSDPSARTGNAYLAEIVTVTQERFDVKEFRANHPDLAAEYTFPNKVEKVELRVVSEDGEITNRPKRTHTA